MKNIHILIILLVSVMLISCEDRFTQLVELEIPDHDPKLVSYCIIDVDNPLILVDLSQSVTIKKDDPEELTSASVSFLEGGSTLVDEFDKDSVFVGINPNVYPEVDSIFKKVYFAPKPQITEGANYSLEISSPGLEGIKATATMPNKVSLDKVTFEEDGSIDPDGSTSDEITIEFNDPLNEDNYYLVSATYEYTYNGNTEISDMWLESLDPRIEETYSLPFATFAYQRFSYFSDKELFNGAKNELKFSTYAGIFGGYEDEKIRIRLYSVSKDLYNFIHAYNLYDNFGDSFFSEPVSIPTNFEGGFGVFGFVNYTDKVIEF